MITLPEDVNHPCFSDYDSPALYRSLSRKRFYSPSARFGRASCLAYPAGLGGACINSAKARR